MKTIRIISALLCVILLFSSCTEEELVSGKVAEGEPVIVSLNMSMATMGSARTTRAMTPEQESVINDVRIMVFNGTRRLITNNKYKGNSTKFSFKTYSGNNMSIYIIANAPEEVDQKMQKISTLDDLRNTMDTDIALRSGPDNNTTPLMMTGELTSVNISPVAHSIPDKIELKFVAAKLTMIVKDETGDDETITILGWDLVDVPNNTYLFSNAKDANKVLAENGGDKNSYWLTTDAAYPFEDVKEKESQQVIYLPENRRGGRVDNGKIPPNGGNINDSSDQNKMWYAPSRASYMAINAKHEKEGKTKFIRACIYLGSNAINNYDVNRSNHYTFTVRILGLTKIEVDTNIDYVAGPFEVKHGDNLIMDAHPDFRAMQILYSGGKATMEIIDGNNRSYGEKGFNATWLKISPLNLMYHQVKQSGAAGDWQEEGLTGYFVRAKYIPHKSYRKSAEGNSKDWGWAGAINSTEGGKQEDDDAMSLKDATHRMCYKITDILFTETVKTTQTLYVYADEYLEKEGSRTAKVRFTFYKNGANENQPDVSEYTITQNGYLPIYDESNPNAGLAVLNPNGTPSDERKIFVVEQYEEVSMKIEVDPGIAGIQATKTMQWGYANTSLYSQGDQNRNGYFMTTNAVYDGNSYRPKYGNGAANKTGVIPEPYNGTTTTPYYYPEATGNIYHPIYKSSAARYCHEKNRDLNGDGKIDASETKWYLPSRDELIMIWIGDKLPDSKNYVSSTENGANEIWKFNSANSNLLQSYTKKNQAYVRCIRAK